MNKKDDSNKTSEVFTIDLSQPNTTYEIPGITQLLNPSKPSETTPPPIVAKHPQQLKDLGVLFDFQFKTDQTFYHFQSALPHAESFIQAWQKELLTGMKLDQSTFSFKESFQEFDSATFSDLYAAFGVQARHWIQAVKVSNAPEILHILVSNRSLVSQQQTILAFFQDTIEIDLAS